MGDQPFFALIFTSSNHPPFDIPAGVVENADRQSPLENAVRYSDYALGQFFEMAKASAYWQNTLFLVVADHVDKVNGQALVPISKFHIPALILGADVKPRVYRQLASQSDLPVTLLGLLGRDFEHPMVGRDLLQLPQHDPGQAVMQFGLNHAVMFGDQVVVQQPNHEPLQFRYVGGELQPVGLDAELALKARVLALWPSYAYFNRQYRMP
jgi:phosphoglycerol transferase MdoB-like AlkP superfamily enzyme